MKKILLLLLFCPPFLAYAADEYKRTTENNAEISNQNELVKQQEEIKHQDEIQHAVDQQFDINHAQRPDTPHLSDTNHQSYQQPEKTPITFDANSANRPAEEPIKTTPIRTTETISPLDFTDYRRQDALKKIQRKAEDEARNKQWAREDEAAAQGRNDEDFATRITKQATADAATDTEKQLVRNKTIVEINRQRIFEDLAEKAKRFEEFKKKYPDFSKKAPFDTLLQLGDMNKFVNMTHDERTRLLNDVNTAIEDAFSNPNLDFQENDINPLCDLIRLTRYHSDDDSELTPTQKTLFDTTFVKEFSSLTPEKQTEIKQNLVNLLKESIPVALDALKKFNNDMEDIKNDINSLETLRSIKNGSNAAFWVTGTIAGVLMLGHTSIAVKGVQLSVEKFAIAAKVGYIAGHTAADLEAELTKHIQDKMQAMFKPLLPKTTELINTISYENQAKSITNGFGSKIKEGIKSLASKASDTITNSAIGKSYKEAKRQVTSMHDHASEWLNKQETYTSAKNKVSSVVDRIIKPIHDHIIDPIKQKLATRHAAKIKATNTSEFTLASKAEDHTPQETTKAEPAKEPTTKNLAQLDFAKYKREEALLKLKRAQEDALRKKQWDREDKAAADVRDKEGFATRLTRKAASDDATDKETEAARNKTLQEINRERILEDFKIKAQKMVDFVEKYPDFAKKAPWDTLLRLGDMDAFVNMKHDERQDLLTTMDATVKNIINGKTEIDPEDAPALLDLTRLTRDSDFSEAQEKAFEAMLNKEFTNLTPTNKEKIKENLISLLKESLPVALKKLTDFDTAMEEIKNDISKLEDLKSLKSSGFASAWVLGTAALLDMFAHKNIVVLAVKVTMEKLAIGAKLGYLVGHKAGTSEAELSKNIQDKMAKIFQPLLPETTELLETITYKNEAKGLGTRIKEGVKGLAYKVDTAIENNLSKTNKDTYRAIKTQIKTTLGIKENTPAAETPPAKQETKPKEETTKSEPSTFTKAADAIRTTLGMKTKAQQIAAIDTSKYSLATPATKPQPASNVTQPATKSTYEVVSALHAA